MSTKTELTTEPKLRRYLSFCRKFHKYNVPQLRFNDIPQEYKQIYRSIYDIHEEDICKATFIVFLLSYVPTSIILFFFTEISIFYSLVLPMISSVLISYSFNIFLYKRIKKDEKVINALLYLIKINFSLLKKTLKENAELCIAFIKLVIDYNIPISEVFVKILNKIHLGYEPEDELTKVITPSKDFNQFKKGLLIKNFEYDYESDYYSETASEKNFRVLIRSLESKIGIVFFIGLFFPLSLCFFVLFQQTNIFFIIFVIPVFLYLLHYLFKKLIKVDVLLIGLINEYSGPKKVLFDEFLLFLEALSLNLEKKYSPEIAFINAYSENVSNFALLNDPFDLQISYLISLQVTFEDFINHLKTELDAPRYRIILDIIYSMLEKSAFYTSEKVREIIKIIQKHRKLEERFKIIIKGNKFVILIFVFLFPAILGTIGGMLPLVIAISRNMNNAEGIAKIQEIHEIVDIKDVIIIFLILISCNIVTCYYLLKIIQHKRMHVVIPISCAIFVFSFLQGILFIFTSV